MGACSKSALWLLCSCQSQVFATYYFHHYLPLTTYFLLVYYLLVYYLLLHYLLSTTSSLLPLPTTYDLLCSTYYLLPTTYYMLPTTYPAHAIDYLLPSTYYLLPTYLLSTCLVTTYYLLLLTTNYCRMCCVLPATRRASVKARLRGETKALLRRESLV